MAIHRWSTGPKFINPSLGQDSFMAAVPAHQPVAVCSRFLFLAVAEPAHRSFNA
jgi:hypothetical protein